MGEVLLELEELPHTMLAAVIEVQNLGESVPRVAEGSFYSKKGIVDQN